MGFNCCSCKPHPTGRDLVGMSKVSFANRRSQRAVVCPLMSATCRRMCSKLRTWLFLSIGESSPDVKVTAYLNMIFDCQASKRIQL